MLDEIRHNYKYKTRNFLSYFGRLSNKTLVSSLSAVILKCGTKLGLTLLTVRNWPNTTLSKLVHERLT